MLFPQRFKRFVLPAIAATFCTLLFFASQAYGEEKEHPTSTPIKHVVVIFQENVSFDHYFATYPVALNPAGEPHFHARPGTPTVNGLSGALLTRNPNLSIRSASAVRKPPPAIRTTVTPMSRRPSTAATWTCSCRLWAPGQARMES